jgi:hypothetical protein
VSLQAEGGDAIKIEREPRHISTHGAFQKNAPEFSAGPLSTIFVMGE